MTSSKKIVGIVLAAGESRRLGQPKQLVLYQGKTLVARAVQTLLDVGCVRVVTVLGAHANLVQDALASLPTSCVVNENWSRGMGSSIATGCGQLGSDVDAALFSLCDHPRIPSAHFKQLIHAFSSRDKPIVATEYQETEHQSSSHGVPAIFAQTCFDSLCQLEGAQGAKDLIRTVDHDAIALPHSQQFDVDTPEDLEQL